MGRVGSGVDAAVGRGALQVSASAQTVGLGLADVPGTPSSQIVPLVIAVSAAGGCTGEGVTARVGVRALGLRGDEKKKIEIFTQCHKSIPLTRF